MNSMCKRNRAALMKSLKTWQVAKSALILPSIGNSKMPFGMIS